MSTPASLAALSFAAALIPELKQHDEDPPVRQPPPSPEVIAKLPPDGGAEFNRLVFEKSPYLLQHARNPVDWYPWSPEAFERAAAEDKPVFLSVGYSTCHWCHVMEHESFEDAEVAALMNEHFVCIKVDREERPDVDQVYMAVTQAMTGSGGWPMTVVMTPDKKPFFAGTYFPKHGRTGRRGMMELIPLLSDAWKTRREDVLKGAQEITAHLAQQTSGSPGEAPDESSLGKALKELEARYDSQRGGFGSAPKFPVPHNLRLLLRHHARTGEAKPLDMVTQTLHEMRKGGIWDHVGFGFHRYSTDPEWLLPHFEKMLYDQALMALACVEAWQVTDDEEFARTAHEIFTYVLRDMTSPEGAFWSAEDADSEGEEGLFYLWTQSELRQVLGKEDGDLAIEAWKVIEGGNFRDQASGQKTGDSILHFDEEPSATAARLGIEPDVFEGRMESIRSRLFEHREARIHPLKDDKVLTDWNGLMISAFARAGVAMNETRYVEAARRAGDFVLQHLVDDRGRLLKRWREGEAAFDGMIEDYAFFVAGLIDLWEATFELRWLEHALALNQHMLDRFWDEEQGGLFSSPDDGEALIVRSKEIYDGAIPSGNSVAAMNLLRLARLTGETELEERSGEIFTAFGKNARKVPSQHTELMLAVDFAAGPAHEVVIAGDPAAEDTAAMLAALRRPFLPNKVVLLRPDGEGEPALAKISPFVLEQTARDGKATAYVCQDFACQAPTNEIEQMLENLGASD